MKSNRSWSSILANLHLAPTATAQTVRRRRGLTAQLKRGRELRIIVRRRAATSGTLSSSSRTFDHHQHSDFDYDYPARQTAERPIISDRRHYFVTTFTQPSSTVRQTIITNNHHHHWRFTNNH